MLLNLSEESRKKLLDKRKSLPSGKQFASKPKSSKPKQMIRCSVCSYETPKWITNSKGNHVSGYGKLQQHFQLAHPDEYLEIQQKLQEEEGESAS